MTAPEFSRIVGTRPHPPERLAVQANADEREALARRFELPAIADLSAELAFAPDGDAIEAKGRLVADVVQTCVVSGEDFTNRIDEALNLRFVPFGAVESTEEEVELASDEPDEIEYDGETFDLGEAVAQSLGLAIDPYPVGPEAEAARRAAGIADESTPSGPLAEALARLKRD